MLTGGAAAANPATMKRSAARLRSGTPMNFRAMATGAPTTRMDMLPAPVSAPGMRVMSIKTSRAATRML